MPELILLTIADKVIFEADGKPSLISLFDRIEVRPTPGQTIPRDAVIPKEWNVFAQWRWLSGESGEEFFQKVEIKYPDGTLFMQGAVKPDSSRERSSVAMGLQGFPVGQTGPYTVSIWMEQNETPVTETFSTIVTVSIKPAEPDEASRVSIAPPHGSRL